MPFDGKCRNLYGDQIFKDLSFVLIKVDASGLVSADSSPDTTSTSAGSGVYNLTFPAGEQGWVVGSVLVKSASDGVFPEVLGFVPTSGVIQVELSDEADLAGSEELHVTVLVGNS